MLVVLVVVMIRTCIGHNILNNLAHLVSFENTTVSKEDHQPPKTGRKFAPEATKGSHPAASGFCQTERGHGHIDQEGRRGSRKIVNPTAIWSDFIDL